MPKIGGRNDAERALPAGYRGLGSWPYRGCRPLGVSGGGGHFGGRNARAER
jgi:hypothetical protein